MDDRMIQWPSDPPGHPQHAMLCRALRRHPAPPGRPRNGCKQVLEWGDSIMPIDKLTTSRRHFLEFLAASPFFASSSLFAIAGETPSRLPDPMTWAARDLDKLIASPKDAINVFDFEPVMFKNVPPAHFGYMASGIDDEVTLRANREGFLKFQLRPRRLVDVSKVDMSVDILGVKYDSPIIVAPTGGHKGYHEDGEIGVAKAAKGANHLMIL